ncbi:MAG: hypothetical protein K9L02_06540, partial [Acholeplasmataceae bacterium]|nr:hypothetical protein [Acholeplasmataceae bacterium]
PDLSEDEHLQRAFDHIKEKYGPDGYLNLWLETKKNREGLNTIHALLQEPSKLKDIIRVYYRNNKINQ